MPWPAHISTTSQKNNKRVQTLLTFSPVAKLGSEGEVLQEEVSLRRNGPLQSEEGVMLHAGFP